MIPLVLIPFIPLIKNLVVDLTSKKGTITDNTLKQIHAKVPGLSILLNEKEFISFFKINADKFIQPKSKLSKAKIKPKKISLKKVKSVKKSKK